jgi:hypothetical protein
VTIEVTAFIRLQKSSHHQQDPALIDGLRVGPGQDPPPCDPMKRRRGHGLQAVPLLRLLIEDLPIFKRR